MLTSQRSEDLSRVAETVWKGTVLRPEQLLELLSGFERWALDCANLRKNDPAIRKVKDDMGVALNRVKHSHHSGESLLKHLQRRETHPIGVRWVIHQVAAVTFQNFRPDFLKKIVELAKKVPSVRGHNALTDDPRCFNLWLHALEEAAEFIHCR